VTIGKYPPKNVLGNSEEIGRFITTMCQFMLWCLSNSSRPRTKLLQSLIYSSDLNYCKFLFSRMKVIQ
jgi:hypothetical protein